MKAVLTFLVVLTFTIGLATPSAFAAEGDIIATIMCAGGNPGVGLAFDGTTLYYLKGAFFNQFTLGTCDTNGVAGADIPIIGAADSISTVAYDVQRDLLWAATHDLGGNNRDIYHIDKTTGIATFQFTVNSIGASLTDGLAYDGQDDTIWVTGDVGTTVSHYQSDGTPIAVNAPVPGTGQLSGVAAGINVLYFGHDGQTIITKHLKSDLSLLATFQTGQGRTEDMDCDPNTFPGVDAIWSKDAFSNNLEAFEVADGTCPLGGGEQLVGGNFIPIDTTLLILAGAQMTASWMIPVMVAGAGIGLFVFSRKSENS